MVWRPLASDEAWDGQGKQLPATKSVSDLRRRGAKVVPGIAGRWKRARKEMRSGTSRGVLRTVAGGRQDPAAKLHVGRVDTPGVPASLLAGLLRAFSAEDGLVG